MPFHSVAFALFFPVVFAGHWLLARWRVRAQNLFLVAASLLFAGWTDARFPFWLLAQALANYFLGRALGAGEAASRRRLLQAGVAFNLALLLAFKYSAFLLGSLVQAVGAVGLRLPFSPPKLLLPLGISYYTLQGIGYLVDVWRRNCEPCRDPAAFLAFVSFFPKLTAGPIERAAPLLPQFLGRRAFDPEKAKDGLRQILWGLYKKILVADSLAPFVGQIFADFHALPASTLLLGAVYYAFQLYADFSAYSDIAVGSARLLGFDLSANFAFPYFAADIREFWQRWHISLSSWLRDYLFLPLAYARERRLRRRGLSAGRSDRRAYAVAVFITWTLAGLWHGAAWTFVAWGMLHGIYLILFHVGKKARHRLYRKMRLRPGRPGLVLLQTLATFLLTTMAWIFFRSASLPEAIAYIGRLFSPSLLSWPTVYSHNASVCLAAMLLVEWLQRRKAHGLEIGAIRSPALRWAVYYTVVIAIYVLGRAQQPFIYFRF